MPTTAEIIADTLKAAGVHRLFGLPGGEIAELLGACRAAGLEFILTRHENAACLMATATAELTRRPSVVLATLGPGATNLVNAVSNAWLERAPVLVISAQVPTATASILPHQRIELEALFRPITKWSHTLTGRDTRAAVEHALRLSQDGRPGPIYLALPSDVAREQEDASAATATPDTTGLSAAPDVTRAARLISEARRPLAVVGPALDPEKIQPTLLRWLDTTRIPALITPKAKGLIPEDHPLFVATCTGMAGDKLVAEFLAGSDLLVGIGFDPVECIRPFYTDRPFLSLAAYGMADRDFAPALEMVGDPRDLLAALLPELALRHTWAAEDVSGFRRRLAGHLTPQADRGPRGLSPARLFARLRALAPRDTIVTVDTGAHKLLLGQIWAGYHPLSYFVSHGLSTMGTALPAAVALKRERPDRPVIAVTGDGGLAMTLGELETVARLQLPVVVVVLADRGLHLIRLQQERKGFRPDGVEFQGIDFAGIAPGFGVHGTRVVAWDQLEPALSEAVQATRPTLIEVQVDPTDYDTML